MDIEAERAKLPSLTIEAFRKWLLEQPAAATYTAMNSKSCPIAVYVDHDFSVGAWAIKLFVGGIPHPITDHSRWVSRFIYMFDKAYSNVDAHPADALKVLANVEAMELQDNPIPQGPGSQF